MQDTFTLYFFAFCLNMVNFISFAGRAATALPQTPKTWICRFLDTLTHAVPPSIPTIFLVLTHIARIRLDRAGISLLYSKALRIAANVTIICFDKTGTLTDSVVSTLLQILST